MTLNNLNQSEASSVDFFPENVKKSTPKERRKVGFELYLDKADAPVEEKPDKKIKPVEQKEKDISAVKDADKPQKKDQPTADKDKKAPSEVKSAADDKKPAVAEEIDAAPEAAALQNLIDIAQEEIVAQIAAILQVPPEVLTQWLSELQISPLMLTNPQVVTELLQKALDVDSPAMLLKQPNFQVLFEAINKAMEPFKPLADLSALEGLRLTVSDENGQLVVQETTAQETETTETAAPRPVTVNPESSADEMLQQGDDEQLMMDQNPLQQQAVNTGSVSKFVDAAGVQAGSRVDSAHVMNQIMSHVQSNPAERFAELRIVLKPENLGDVTLKVATQNGIVTAQFVAENQRVREVLEANFNQLRDVLQQKGLQISELSVSVRQGNEEERMNQFLQARQSGRRRLSRINRQSVAVEPEAPPEPVKIIDSNVDLLA